MCWPMSREGNVGETPKLLGRLPTQQAVRTSFKVIDLSVRPSVACLDLTRKRKGIGSPESAGWKPITRVTRKPI